MKSYISHIFILMFFVAPQVIASPFGADIPLLAQIAATTAKELKTTLELLKVSKDTVDNVKEANTQINTYRETMSRIERLAIRAERLSKARVSSHAELNNELRSLHSTINETKRMSEHFEKEYGPELKKIQKTGEAKIAMGESINLPTVTQSMIDIRTTESYNGTSQATHSQNTAINTALTNEILLESTNRQYLLASEQLEYFKEQRMRNLELKNEQEKSSKFLGGQ